jgi:hypothetical protein
VAIRVRITTTDILMDVTVVRPGAVTVTGMPQAYPTWQQIRATATSGFDPWCPFFFDSVAVADATRFAISTPKADAVSATDVAAWFVTFNRNPTDSVTATDSVTTLKTFLRTQDDPVTVTDATTQVMAFNSSFNDPVTVTDSVVAGFQYYQTPNDFVNSDDTVIAFSLSRSVGDAATASDATIAFSLSRPVADSATATDGATTALSLPRTASDSATVSDSLQIVWRRANIYGEVANASPLNTAALNSSVAWAEQWTFNY